MNHNLVETWKQRVTGMPGFILFAGVVSFAYFGPFLHNFFTADDLFCLQDLLHGPGRVLVGYDNNLRIASNFFWLPLHALFGLEPFGYNLFCLILYLLNSIILYCLIYRLFANRLLAFITAGIFITSGIGADAVLWRAASATLLNTCWYLLALYAHVLFRQLKERKYRYLSLVLFLAAMFSKEEAASLPCIILLLELLLNREPMAPKKLIGLIVPYMAIIAFYLLINHFIIHDLLHAKSFMAGIIKVRPLYSMFAGYSAFFISPMGRLAPSDPLIFITAVLIPASFSIARDKKLLLFGYLWIFFAFLPQSMSSQSQFQGDMLVNSISRHLYLPSVGSSLVLATLLLDLRAKLPPRLHGAACLLFFILYITLHYSLVNRRGHQWQSEGAYVQRFVQEMQNLLPTIPENSYVTVTAPPVGRAFTQAALRAFYNNPKIFWKDNLQELQHLPVGAHGILIDFAWEENWYYGRPPRAFIIKP